MVSETELRELMEARELMDLRQVVDEVVDAHVESEVAYLELYPTKVKGLVWCHRVRGMDGDVSM